MDFVTNIAGDLHLEPLEDNERLPAPLVELLLKSKEEPLILDGDTLNLLRNDREKFRYAIRLMSSLAGPEGNVMLIKGNHDPLDDLLWLIKNYSTNASLICGEAMWVPIRDTYILVTHGHEWCLQWGLGLDLIAQPFMNLMMKISPRSWEYVAEKFGWAGPAVSESRYHATVLSVWAGAIRHAAKNGCRVIPCHTHKLGGVVELYDYGIDYVMASPAPLSVGSYIQVTDHIEHKTTSYQDLRGRV